MLDVAIVGGGPAGLAVAIHAARRGLSVQVLEAAPGTPDKACGEGLMPAGVAALAELGVALRPEDSSPFAGIRYVQEDGGAVDARFRDGPGLGVRRTALVRALRDRAEAAGALVRSGCAVSRVDRGPGGVRLDTHKGEVLARVLIGADGLHSRVRRWSGLERRVGLPRRFGVRRHYRMRAWSPFVEVHWGVGAEAYVTPVGDSVNIAFLWSAESFKCDELLGQFPVLAERLRGVDCTSTVRGAGPLAVASRARVADRLVLIGDAAGFLDGITGEGLSIAFKCAEALGELLPRAITRSGERAALSPYERVFAREYRRYEWLTRSLLWLARHPSLRRRALRLLAARPRVFESVLHLAIAPVTRGHTLGSEQKQMTGHTPGE